MNEERRARIRALNDRLRQTGAGGMIVHTSGIAALGEALLGQVARGVIEFDAFTPDNDPYSEHDFGSFEVEGRTIFWKVDYYDLDLTGGSPDPADESVTTRVLTIMLAEEY
jgi:hypothetical protein